MESNMKQYRDCEFLGQNTMYDPKFSVYHCNKLDCPYKNNGNGICQSDGMVSAKQDPNFNDNLDRAKESMLTAKILSTKARLSYDAIFVEEVDKLIN